MPRNIAASPLENKSWEVVPRAITASPMGNKSTFLTKQPSVQAVMPVELAAENIQVANPPENQINRCNLSTSLEEMSLVAGKEASSTFHDVMSKTSNPALATKLSLTSSIQ